MPVAENKTRVQVTFLKEDVKASKAIADSLGLSLSNYIAMVVHAVNQQDLNKAFQTVVDTLQDGSIT